VSHVAPTRIDLSDSVGFLSRAVSAVTVGLDANAFDALPQRTGVVPAAQADA